MGEEMGRGAGLPVTRLPSHTKWVSLSELGIHHPLRTKHPALGPGALCLGLGIAQPRVLARVVCASASPAAGGRAASMRPRLSRRRPRVRAPCRKEGGMKKGRLLMMVKKTGDDAEHTTLPWPLVVGHWRGQRARGPFWPPSASRKPGNCRWGDERFRTLVPQTMACMCERAVPCSSHVHTHMVRMRLAVP